jgi:LysM repeat protein
MLSPSPHPRAQVGPPAWQPILGGLAAVVAILAVFMAAAFLSQQEQLLAAVPTPSATAVVPTNTPSSVPSMTPSPLPATPTSTARQPSEETASPTPTPTAQPTRTPTRTRRPTAPARKCTPNTSWPIYIVQSGDTLYNIAWRTGTFVATLKAANCLYSDKIWVGMPLRVPKLPAPAPSATPTTPPTHTATAITPPTHTATATQIPPPTATHTPSDPPNPPPPDDQKPSATPTPEETPHPPPAAQQIPEESTRYAQRADPPTSGRASPFAWWRLPAGPARPCSGESRV